MGGIFININISFIKKNKFILNLLIIISFALLSILSVLLLFHKHILYIGADTQFNLKRIIEFRESFIDKNIILPRFSINEFHGSIVMGLYPYLNLLPAILFSYIITSPINSIYTFFACNIFLAFLISFYACNNYIKSYLTSYIFSVIYSLSIVFFFQNVITNDFGITSSYILLPLIIFGFLQIIQKRGGVIELSIGTSLLFYSHILNLLIIVIFLLLLFLVNIKNADKLIIKNIFKSIIIFIILTSIIWLPFLYYYFNNLFNINLPVSIQLNNVNIKKFISGIYGGKSTDTIGFFPIVSLFISPLFYKNFNKYVKQMYLLSLLIILAVLFLPWNFITSIKIFSFLNQLQYTFRFLIIPQMLLIFIFALIFTKYIRINNKYIFIIVILLLTIILQIFAGQFVLSNVFSNNSSNRVSIIPIDKNQSIYKNGVINDIRNTSQFNFVVNDTYNNQDNDYIPKSALSMSSYVNHNLGIYNGNRKIKVKRIGHNTFNFSGNKSINELSLPIYVYNKEKINVYLNDRLINKHYDKNGLLTINNIQNNTKPNNNKIYIKTIPNIFEIIGVILSIFGWLFVLGLIIKRKVMDLCQ